MISFEPRLPVTDSPSGQNFYDVAQPVDISTIVFFRDSVIDVGYTGHIITDGVDRTVASWTAPPIAPSKASYGSAYPAYYISPSFALESLNRVKSMSHLSVIFDNTLGHDVWRHSQLVATQDVGVVDTYRQRLNSSLLYIVNYAFNGITEMDLYRYPALTWDAGEYDVAVPVDQFLTNQIHKIPLQGSAYSVQFCLFSYDETAFRLNAYQLMGKVHPGNSSFQE